MTVVGFRTLQIPSHLADPQHELGHPQKLRQRQRRRIPEEVILANTGRLLEPGSKLYLSSALERNII